MDIVVYRCEDCKKYFLDAENESQPASASWQSDEARSSSDSQNQNVTLDNNMLILKISPAEFARKNIKIAGGICEECSFTELPSMHAESIIEYMNDCNNSMIDDPTIPLSVVLDSIRKMDSNLDIGSLEVRLRAAMNA